MNKKYIHSIPEHWLTAPNYQPMADFAEAKRAQQRENLINDYQVVYKAKATELKAHLDLEAFVKDIETTLFGTKDIDPGRYIDGFTAALRASLDNKTAASRTYNLDKINNFVTNASRYLASVGTSPKGAADMQTFYKKLDAYVRDLNRGADAAAAKERFISSCSALGINIKEDGYAAASKIFSGYLNHAAGVEGEKIVKDAADLAIKNLHLNPQEVEIQDTSKITSGSQRADLKTVVKVIDSENIELGIQVKNWNLPEPKDPRVWTRSFGTKAPGSFWSYVEADFEGAAPHVGNYIIHEHDDWGVADPVFNYMALKHFPEFLGDNVLLIAHRNSIMPVHEYLKKEAYNLQLAPEVKGRFDSYNEWEPPTRYDYDASMRRSERVFQMFRDAKSRVY